MYLLFCEQLRLLLPILSIYSVINSKSLFLVFEHPCLIFTVTSRVKFTDHLIPSRVVTVTIFCRYPLTRSLFPYPRSSAGARVVRAVGQGLLSRVVLELNQWVKLISLDDFRAILENLT